MRMQETSEAIAAMDTSAAEAKNDMIVYAIDDNSDVAEYLADVAIDAGFAAQSASTFKKFSSTFKNEKDVILILDLTMPDKDGVEYMDFLRKQNFVGKIILISGYNTQTLELVKRLGDAFMLNIEAALTKPIDATVLTDTLRKCVLERQN